ncbi:hypothetical protein KI387_041530, partial [Taxus chinensis]
IELVKGKDNLVVDALRRQRHVAMGTLVVTNLRSRIFQQLPNDSFYLASRAEIESQRPLDGIFDGFSLEADGLIRHR